MAAPSNIDIVPGFDVSGYPSLNASQLAALVEGIAPYADKGFVLVSADVGGLPEVPNAAVTTKWQKYVWIRTTGADAILYIWNPDVADDPTFLKWVQVNASGISDNTLNGSKLVNNSVSSGKIISLDWGKIINTPANSGDIGGVYPALVINALAVTSAKLAAGAVTAGKIGPNAVSFGNLDAALQTKITAPAGMIAMFATPNADSAPPAGWLFCDGSEVLIADYINLKNAIYVGNANNNNVDITYGYLTDGSGNRALGGTHIKLPDLRGQFLRGWNPEATGTDANRQWASSQLDDIKAHVHETKYNGLGAANSGVGFLNNTASSFNVNKALSAPSTDSMYANPATAGRPTTETRPYNIVAAYCIKY